MRPSQHASVAVWWCLLGLASASHRNCGPEPAFRSDGDVRLTVIVNECNSTALAKTAVLNVAWICERINVLEHFANVRLGATVHVLCDEREMLAAALEATAPEEYPLGVVLWNPAPSKLLSLSHLLDVPVSTIPKQWKTSILASIGLLTILRWTENVTVATSDPEVLRYFFHESRKEWICVSDVRGIHELPGDSYEGPVLMIGTGDELGLALKQLSEGAPPKSLVVPTDGAQVEGLQDGHFVIYPAYADAQQEVTPSPKIAPGPILLDIASPIINIARNFSSLLMHSCNETYRELPCVRRHHPTYPAVESSEVAPHVVLDFLKIEPLRDKFVYDVFRVESVETLVHTPNDTRDALRSYLKVGRYDLFNYTMYFNGMYLEVTNSSPAEGCGSNHHLCVEQCVNFNPPKEPPPPDEYDFTTAIRCIVLRQDPWILAVLSVASLGVLVCLAILTFIFVRLCKKDIFEGNPVLSVLLLLALTVTYAAVVPFGLEADESNAADYVCTARVLALTLSYSCVFSLMLSRCVMLATAAHEAGFMSHIAGHVQSLLCLFMVAVQGALSLQSVEHCAESFDGRTLLYTLSYNGLLLALLLCACPFVYRSQRNYREGRHFVVAILVVCCVWSAWLSVYVLAGERWRTVAVCAGLLGTATAVVGTVFVPRTYAMTSAVVRDHLTSALPSLAFASSTSVLDLNYANAQHIYDCVNVAAINAATQPQQPQHNYYSGAPPPAAEQQDVSESPCRTPDKVTRF